MKPFAHMRDDGADGYEFCREKDTGSFPIYTAAQLEQARREGAADLACFRSLIKFLLRSDVDEREQFLRLWNEGSFEQCRKWWPEAPEEVYPNKEVA